MCVKYQVSDYLDTESTPELLHSYQTSQSLGQDQKRKIPEQKRGKKNRTSKEHKHGMKKKKKL